MVVVLARQATLPGGIGSLESILELLKSLKIRALENSPPIMFFSWNNWEPEETATQATQPGGIGSLESILWLL